MSLVRAPKLGHFATSLCEKTHTTTSTDKMNTSLFLLTEVYARIEPPPILMIKKKVEIKDKISSRLSSGTIPEAHHPRHITLKWGTLSQDPQNNRTYPNKL